MNKYFFTSIDDAKIISGIEMNQKDRESICSMSYEFLDEFKQGYVQDILIPLFDDFCISNEIIECASLVYKVEDEIRASIIVTRMEDGICIQNLWCVSPKDADKLGKCLKQAILNLKVFQRDMEEEDPENLAPFHFIGFNENLDEEIVFRIMQGARLYDEDMITLEDEYVRLMTEPEPDLSI